MGTKRAKGGHLAPGAIQCAKKCAPQVALVFTISVFSLSSTPGRTTDLLKWGLPGGGVKSAKVAPTPYVYYPRVRRRGWVLERPRPKSRETE